MSQRTDNSNISAATTKLDSYNYDMPVKEMLGTVFSMILTKYDDAVVNHDDSQFVGYNSLNDKVFAQEQLAWMAISMANAEICHAWHGGCPHSPGTTTASKDVFCSHSQPQTQIKWFCIKRMMGETYWFKSHIDRSVNLPDMHIKQPTVREFCRKVVALQEPFERRNLVLDSREQLKKLRVSLELD